MNPQPFSKVEIGDAARSTGPIMADRRDWLQPFRCTLDRRLFDILVQSDRPASTAAILGGRF